MPGCEMKLHEKTELFIILPMLLIPVCRVSADSRGYIVKFNTDISSVFDTSRFAEIGENKNTYKIDDLNDLGGLNQYIAYCEANDEVDLIEGIEPISLFKLPDDELYSQQWQTQMINADYAWEFETYGNQVNVAVIDSGCNAHVDLNDNLAGGYNYTDKSKSNDFSDNVGHGTHVTGIIAAQMNGIGIVGAAPKANIYALKCVDKYVSAGTDILATAIYDAVDKYNCRVINLSLGIKLDKNVIYDAVKYAYEKGVIIVAAVGNDGNDTIYYPAGYDEVIGVGSVGIAKEKSYFSQKNESVFVVAPGEKVKSLKGTDEYILMQGTSQAAPLVTGAAAIMFSVDEDVTPQKFKELLKTTSADLGDIGKDNLYGWGLLNVEKLMDSAMGDCYVSPINEGKVVVYNNTGSIINAEGIWANYSGNKYIGGETEKLLLMPQKKIKLKHMDCTEETKFFLWQSLNNMKPLTKNRIGGR